MPGTGWAGCPQPAAERPQAPFSEITFAMRQGRPWDGCGDSPPVSVRVANTHDSNSPVSGPGVLSPRSHRKVQRGVVRTLRVWFPGFTPFRLHPSSFILHPFSIDFLAIRTFPRLDR